MKAAGRIEEIQRLSPRVVVHATTGPRDATRIARELAAAGAPLIVAAGGDGTVNEVINGIMACAPETSTALGVLPAGTMNVFANDLGLPCKSIHQCWEVITSVGPREIDLWSANGHCFVQLAGAGLDAAVIAGTTWERKKQLGPFSYVLNALRLMNKPSPLLTVRVPGRAPIQGRVVLLGNGRHYGGPFRLFPHASFSDGRLEVVVMEKHRLRDVLRLGLAAATARYGSRPGLISFQADAVEITSEERVPFEIDGELCGHTPVSIRKHTRPLRVIGG